MKIGRILIRSLLFLKNVHLSCLDGDNFIDLEDGYQFQSALSCGADVLLTINKKDFVHADASLLSVFTPDEFLERL